MHSDRVLVTTLTVGIDSCGYVIPNDFDRAYIVEPKSKVEDWTKRAILRSKGNVSTDQITKPFSLISPNI